VDLPALVRLICGLNLRLSGVPRREVSLVAQDTALLWTSTAETYLGRGLIRKKLLGGEGSVVVFRILLPSFFKHQLVAR